MVSCHLLKHSASYLPSAHSNPEPSIRLRCKRFAFNQNQMNSSSLYYAVVVVDVFHQDAITRRFRAIQHLEFPYPFVSFFIGSTTDLGILIPWLNSDGQPVHDHPMLVSGILHYTDHYLLLIISLCCCCCIWFRTDGRNSIGWGSMGHPWVSGIG